MLPEITPEKMAEYRAGAGGGRAARAADIAARPHRARELARAGAQLHT